MRMAAIVVLACAAALALSTTADAKSKRSPTPRQQPVTVFCGDGGTRYCPAVKAPAPARRAASRGRARHKTARHSRPAREASLQAPQGIQPGVVRSRAGAKASVAPRNRAAFQAYIDDLESRGARVLFMGGYRKGHCSAASQHPCGGALDVCQTRRGAVDPRCRLPGRRDLVKIARQHGLYEGGEWCNSDYGHVQARPSASPCGTNLYASVTRWKQQVKPGAGAP